MHLVDDSQAKVLEHVLVVLFLGQRLQHPDDDVLVFHVHYRPLIFPSRKLGKKCCIFSTH